MKSNRRYRYGANCIPCKAELVPPNGLPIRARPKSAIFGAAVIATTVSRLRPTLAPRNSCKKAGSARAGPILRVIAFNYRLRSNLSHISGDHCRGRAI